MEEVEFDFISEPSNIVINAGSTVDLVSNRNQTSSEQNDDGSISDESNKSVERYQQERVLRSGRVLRSRSRSPLMKRRSQEQFERSRRVRHYEQSGPLRVYSLRKRVNV